MRRGHGRQRDCRVVTVAGCCAYNTGETDTSSKSVRSIFIAFSLFLSGVNRSFSLGRAEFLVIDRVDAKTRAEISVETECASLDRKSTRLNSSHGYISYAVFCLKKKKKHKI